jgi:hypothetical protein
VNDNQIRQRYLYSMALRAHWLNRYREGEVPVDKEARRIMWVAATDVAKGAATRHYKRKQGQYYDSSKTIESMSPAAEERYEVLLDRTLEFIEFIKSADPNRDIEWIVSAWYSRFGEYDKRLQLEKRNRVGFSFTETPIYEEFTPESNDWEYGTKKTPQKPRSHRIKYVTHHSNMEALVNCVYNEFGDRLGYQQIFEYLVSTKKYNARQAYQLAEKIHRYFLSTDMQRLDDI